MIVAYPPGGGTDIVGRMVAQKLGERSGRAWWWRTAAERAETSAPSWPRAPPPTAIPCSWERRAERDQRQPVKDLPFDPVGDFAPVSLVASTPNILVVHPSTPQGPSKK